MGPRRAGGAARRRPARGSGRGRRPRPAGLAGPGIARALAELGRRRAEHGPEAAAAKRELVTALGRSDLGSAKRLLAFHEELLFLRAVPDDAAQLAVVERELRRFADRRDLARLRDELADSGVAGTDTWYPFFHATAAWLARRWPGRLEVDWEATGEEAAESARLERLLPLLAHYAETPGLDDEDVGGTRA